LKGLTPRSVTEAFILGVQARRSLEGRFWTGEMKCDDFLPLEVDDCGQEQMRSRLVELFAELLGQSENSNDSEFREACRKATDDVYLKSAHSDYRRIKAFRNWIRLEARSTRDLGLDFNAPASIAALAFAVYRAGLHYIEFGRKEPKFKRLVSRTLSGKFSNNSILARQISDVSRLTLSDLATEMLRRETLSNNLVKISDNDLNEVAAVISLRAAEYAEKLAQEYAFKDYESATEFDEHIMRISNRRVIFGSSNIRRLALNIRRREALPEPSNATEFAGRQRAQMSDRFFIDFERAAESSGNSLFRKKPIGILIADKGACGSNFGGHVPLDCLSSDAKKRAKRGKIAKPSNS